MTDLIDKMYAHKSDLLFVTPAQYRAALEGWTLEPLTIAGVLAFILVSKGPEFHYVSFETGHRLPLKLFANRCMKLHRAFGYFETRTPKEDRKQQHFNERVGMKRIGEDAYDYHYRLTDVPVHLTRLACQ
jgi:hypothetical protein